MSGRRRRLGANLRSYRTRSTPARRSAFAPPRTPSFRAGSQGPSGLGSGVVRAGMRVGSAGRAWSALDARFELVRLLGASREPTSGSACACWNRSDEWAPRRMFNWLSRRRKTSLPGRDWTSRGSRQLSAFRQVSRKRLSVRVAVAGHGDRGVRHAVDARWFPGSGSLSVRHRSGCCSTQRRASRWPNAEAAAKKSGSNMR